MNLKKLSHIELDLEIKKLSKKERELLSEILSHIQECERRRLHLEFGYSSLFAYLTKHIGYSEGAAQRRIDAARLMTEIPEVQAKIESGEIHLGHVALIQKASRQMNSMSGSKLDQNLKAEALKGIEQKSFQASEKIVAQIFDLPVQTETKCTQQKDESVRIELTLTKAQAEKLEKVKELMSHLVPDGSITGIFDILMTQKLAATVAVKKSPAAKNPKAAKSDQCVNPENKTITPKTRKIILQRDECCQFKSPITGKICGSNWQLQVDHRQSKWADGTNAPENLGALCGQHNRLKYRKEAGIDLH